MKISILSLQTAFALAVSAAPAAAQYAVELRGGAAVGNHAPAASGLETLPGPSISAALELRARPFASLYAALVRTSFRCEEGFCTGRNANVTTMGYGAGIRLHPTGLPWLRAGGLMYDATVRADGESDRVDASLGYEVAAGFTVPLWRAVRVLPGAYFRTQAGDERTTLVGAEVGVHISSAW